MSKLEALPLYSLLGFFLTFSALVGPSASGIDSFVYVGCSQFRYNPGTPYETNVNSVLTSLVNSASSASFNNFKISVPGSTNDDIIYGLYQCRGDLGNSDCHDCVAHAVSQLGTICVDSTGGALQLEGCFIKYDNLSFLGTEDKTVTLKKCGPPIGYNSDTSTRRDAVLDYLGAAGQYFRVGGSGKAQGMAQCVQDMDLSECQDCLSEAIGQLKSSCGSAAWGDMYLGKCYARYSESGEYSNSESGDHDEFEKTLAILIGLIAGIAVLVVFLSILRKLFEKKGGK
ncbi:hypothetical protein NMG60_11023694 [Bertholletia excelsa]